MTWSSIMYYHKLFNIWEAPSTTYFYNMTIWWWFNSFSHCALISLSLKWRRIAGRAVAVRYTREIETREQLSSGIGAERSPRGIIASSTADRVTLIYVYPMEFISWSSSLIPISCCILKIPLYSSQNRITSQRRVVETRRGSFKDLSSLRVTTRVITIHLSTSMTYVSLITNSVLIESRSRAIIYVLKSTTQAGALLFDYCNLISLRHCRGQSLGH